ncbi:hypothetical protein F2Q70_00036686 [Brassica cretica]|uniref:Uncharacterized protein n=1 Tax=Brassica cretica TaxID=69181 RepID=A0A8S9JTZ4_BRACR|nr:hypothetical protein F2Q70_00036686 [Brassica cretica]
MRAGNGTRGLHPASIVVASSWFVRAGKGTHGLHPASDCRHCLSLCARVGDPASLQPAVARAWRLCRDCATVSSKPRPSFLRGVSISISTACSTTGSRPSTTLLQFSCYPPSRSAQLHRRVLVPVESSLAVGIQIRRKEVVSSNGGFWSYCTSGPSAFGNLRIDPKPIKSA